MRARGYGAIGVAEICERAGVRKGSFYYFFESKQALTVEALRHAWQEEREAWRAVLGSRERPFRRLEALLRAQVKAQYDSKRDVGVVRGCLYGNLVLEVGGNDEVVHACLAEILDEQVALVHTVLLDAHAEGLLPPTRATRAHARAVLAQLEGMVLFAKLDNDPELLNTLWEHVEGVLALN